MDEGVRALSPRDVGRGVEARGGGGAVAASGQEQLAVLAMELRRVEALAAPLRGAERFIDGVEGGAGLAGLREGRGQQAEEVGPEFFRAKCAQGQRSLS